MSVNLGGRPNLNPYFNIECQDFIVADPVAPEIPVLMLFSDQSIKLTMKIKITGYFKDLFTASSQAWETNFYVNSLGIDVTGERHWTVTGPLPPPVAPDTYEISYVVGAGMLPQGVYEFGGLTRLPSRGINAFGEGDHVEYSAR